MLLRMTALTFVHVVISLVGVGSGFVVMYGLPAAKRNDGWAAVFLGSNILTSATGFLFPFERLLPLHFLAILSLLVLGIAVYARYTRRLAAGWRLAYVVSAVTALYFNVFVLVVQSFQTIPALHVMAPTQAEPPFVRAQLAVLAIFIILGISAAITNRREPAHVS